MSTDPHVAPLAGGFTGPHRKKPWQYLTTVMIPHLDTPECLRRVVELHRLQTERPYIMVVDTGSPRAVCDELEAMRAEDLEVHYVRSGGYLHSSHPVAVAIDLTMSLCASEFLFLTHADCFPVRRDLLAHWRKRCGPHRPVYGYQMSPRTMDPKAEWKTCVSHTATVLHMPTMRRLGARWSIYDYADGDRSTWRPGWPDTESRFGELLRRAGIKPRFVGPEPNFRRHTDQNIDHVRSFPGAKMYHAEYFAKASAWMANALELADRRIARWRAEADAPAGPDPRLEKCVHLGNVPLDYLTPEGKGCGCERLAVYSCDHDDTPARCCRFTPSEGLGYCQECPHFES